MELMRIAVSSADENFGGAVNSAGEYSLNLFKLYSITFLPTKIINFTPRSGRTRCKRRIAYKTLILFLRNS